MISITYIMESALLSHSLPTIIMMIIAFTIGVMLTTLWIPFMLLNIIPEVYFYAKGTYGRPSIAKPLMAIALGPLYPTFVIFRAKYWKYF